MPVFDDTESEESQDSAENDESPRVSTHYIIDAGPQSNLLYVLKHMFSTKYTR